MNETEDEFIYRVCRNKDLKVYDLTWVEVGDVLNRELERNQDESSYRKEYAALQRGIDLATERSIEDEEVLEEIAEKKKELYKQQTKTRDKLREMRKHLRDEARVENLVDDFTRCAEIVSKEKPLELNTYPKPSGERVGVALLSDWHLGETVENFMNTYNKEIFNERVNQLTTEIINYCKTMNVSALKVLNLGDLISGGLHVSTRVADEEDRIQQVMYVSEVLSTMLLEFAKNINKVGFYSVVDNHSRDSRNKMEHIEKESFSMFIPWYLKTRLSNVHNIEIINNKINGIDECDIGMIDILGEKAIFTHGHNGRMNSMVSDLALMTRTFPIAIFMGHFHKNFEEETHGIDLIMNPSMVGVGNYAKRIRRSSAPRQKLAIFEKREGKVERICTFMVNL